ncbi:amidohydrolase [Bacillus pfraonensis]|uniref:amidohydrolase n=1 Tax=Bacillus TaxID=1386 RepID=UPI002A52E339|nr:amidohydrolase [Bacillus pseudomycoides]
MTKKADVILSSDAVFTGTKEISIPASIVVKDNKIIALVQKDNIQDYVDTHTRIYDFGNQLIMPGFHDFHIHLMLGSLVNEGVQLIHARSAKEVARLVKKHADENKNAPCVIGSSWEQNLWESEEEPHRNILDECIADRPVFLYHAEFHCAWLNSKALEMAGIHRGTKNPPYGEIVKDQNGEPTGILKENAVGLATNILQFTPKRNRALLQSFLIETAKYGVTSVHDLLRIPEMGVEEAELYDEFEKEGKLTTRIHFVAPLNGDLKLAKHLNETYNSNMVQFCGFKQFIDGVTTSYTAYLLEPYCTQETSGYTTYPPEIIKKWTVDADKEGFRVRFHAIGDGAVRLALDAFEEAQMRNGKRDARHAIEHVEMIHPSDIERFQKLGALASIQPEHINLTSREVYKNLIGLERMQHNYLMKTLMDAGAMLVFGSDYPVVTLNPLPEIYRAVTRLDDEGIEWNSQEKISLAEALWAYTYAPAYASFREDELGTIEEGKLADIVVLDRNLFDVPVTEIKEASVIFTMVDGKVVYQAEKQVVQNEY